MKCEKYKPIIAMRPEEAKLRKLVARMLQFWDKFEELYGVEPTPEEMAYAWAIFNNEN